MCFEKLIENVRLANVELATDNAAVVYTQHSINVFHALRAYVSELLDFGRRVLDLIVREIEFELLNTALNSVPTRKTVASIIWQPRIRFLPWR